LKQNCLATNQTRGVHNFNSIDRIRSLTKEFWLPVSGASMLPVLRDGDLVSVSPIAREDVKNIVVGTIVLLEHNNELVVHRLVGSHNSFLEERGDRNGKIKRIDFSDVIGIVNKRKRNGKEKRIGLPLVWKLRSLLK